MDIKFIGTPQLLEKGGGDLKIILLDKMLQIVWTFNMFKHLPYYAGLLHMLGFLLSPKAMSISVISPASDC